MDTSDYRVIIFDLDGTAIPNVQNSHPSETIIEAIAEAQSKIKLCAATGRPLANARHILQALQLSEPCVIAAGTQIVNPQTGNILWEVVIEPNDVHSIIDICRPYNYELLLNDELIGSGTTAAERTVEGTVNVMYFMSCAAPDAEEILAQLATIPTITAAGVTSWAQDGIDIHITHAEATKEHAVAELLRILDIPKAAAIGVGDANNDVHLFKAVGHKVAMGNATDVLKSQADEVCDGVENDGLAKIIQKYA